MNVTDAPRWENVRDHSTPSLVPPMPLWNYHRTVLNIRCQHSHCNVIDKGFWTCSSSWVMQYTLARQIPTHPTCPAFLKYLPSLVIRKLHCLRLVGESGGKNNACNANDKPPSWVYHLPAGSVTRFTWGRVWEWKNPHNYVTVQNRTHVYMNFFDHKDLGKHLLQYCPKVLKHPVYHTLQKWAGIV